MLLNCLNNILIFLFQTFGFCFEVNSNVNPIIIFLDDLNPYPLHNSCTLNSVIKSHDFVSWFESLLRSNHPEENTLRINVIYFFIESSF